MSIRRVTGFIAAIGIVLTPATATTISAARAATPAPTVIAAGVPAPIAATHDYNQIYGWLEQGGMKVFFPYFATDDLLTEDVLQFEFLDFYGRNIGLPQASYKTTCDPNSPAFTQLSAHHVQLLLSSDVMYPPTDFPSMAQDPLKTLIGCAGRTGIFGVLSYDEPVKNNVSLAQLQTLYNRVKAVDPTIPVLMVNAPLTRVDANGNQITPAQVTSYFNAVAAAQAYGDALGFDLYPIPKVKLYDWTSPYTAGNQSPDYQSLLGDYVNWLHSKAGTKPTWMALQGFTFDSFQQFPTLPAPSLDLANPTTVIPPTLSFSGGLDLGQAGPIQGGCLCGTSLYGPSESELQTMVQITLNGGATMFGWYGQSFVSQENVPDWRTVINGQPTPTLYQSIQSVSLATQSGLAPAQARSAAPKPPSHRGDQSRMADDPRLWGLHFF